MCCCQFLSLIDAPVKEQVAADVLVESAPAPALAETRGAEK
jgi:hypothetical protein